VILLLESVIESMPTSQVVLALTVAFSMLAIVLELVRRQKLRDEYAILWIGTAIVLIVLALSPEILTWFSAFFETQSLVSMLYFGAFMFLLLVALQFSVRLTKLTFRSKTTSQRIALLEAEIEALRKQVADRGDTKKKPTEPTVEIPKPPIEIPVETQQEAEPPRDEKVS
jgi:hypothetical protein